MGWIAQSKGWCWPRSSTAACLHLSWNRSHKSHTSMPFGLDPPFSTRPSWSRAPCPSSWAPPPSQSRRWCSESPGISRTPHNSACFQIQTCHNRPTFSARRHLWDGHTYSKHFWGWTRGSSFLGTPRCTSSLAGFRWLCTLGWSNECRIYGFCTEGAFRCTFGLCNFS